MKMTSPAGLESQFCQSILSDAENQDRKSIFLFKVCAFYVATALEPSQLIGRTTSSFSLNLNSIICLLELREHKSLEAYCLDKL